MQVGEIQGSSVFSASVRKAPKAVLLRCENVDTLPSRGRCWAR